MSGAVPKKSTWADDSDSSDANEAPVSSASRGGRRNGISRSWAESDTDSDAEHAAPPPRKVDAFGESESDSEEEEEESEDEVDGGRHGDAELLHPPEETGEEPSADNTAGEDLNQLQNLSKKERKALKQKELADLDALLGEFGVDVAPSAEEGAAEQSANDPSAAMSGALNTTEASAAGVDSGDIAKKKKKKKKDKKADDAAGESRASAGGDSEVVVVQPISSALKNKGKKKPAANNPGAAAAKALREAAKKEGKPKKKRDKTNFNQAPPGK